MSQIQQWLQSLQDQDLVEVFVPIALPLQFFDDTILYLKGNRVPFLSKYQESLGAGNVVPLREFLIDIIQVGLRKSAPLTTLDVLKEGILNYVQT